MSKEIFCLSYFRKIDLNQALQCNSVEMSSCELQTEVGQLYAMVKQLTANTEQLKLDNVALRTELKLTREWLFHLNDTVAKLALLSQQSKSPRSPPALDENEEVGWP